MGGTSHRRVGGVVDTGDRLLTPGEVAALFRVDPKTVTRWAAAGRIGSIRTPGGHRRFRESEVRALLEGEGLLEPATDNPPAGTNGSRPHWMSGPGRSVRPPGRRPASTSRPSARLRARRADPRPSARPGTVPRSRPAGSAARPGTRRGRPGARRRTGRAARRRRTGYRTLRSPRRPREYAYVQHPPRAVGVTATGA